MARHVSTVFNNHPERFIEQEVTSGRYDSIDEVVQEGLRLLEDHQARLETLREALIAGENSGMAGLLDIDAFLTERHAEWQNQRENRRS